MLSTDLLDNSNAAIRLCDVRLVFNECVVEVKTAILFQLYALNTINSLKKTITLSGFARKRVIFIMFIFNMLI